MDKEKRDWIIGLGILSILVIFALYLLVFSLTSYTGTEVKIAYFAVCTFMAFVLFFFL